MCLIYFAHRVDPRYRLVVAANRDEFHARETSPVHWWKDHKDVLAGRDLRAGGTWMGVSRAGRFAALTNYREITPTSNSARTRGTLVSDFLTSTDSALTYLQQVAQQAQQYNGFSLLVDDGNSLCVYSNRGPAPRVVTPGVHGLSNHLLNTPWPKVAQGSVEMADMLPGQSPNLMALLEARGAADDSVLPDTGVGYAREKALSARFIHAPVYGTRSSTTLFISVNGEVLMQERRFDASGDVIEDEVHRYQITS